MTVEKITYYHVRVDVPEPVWGAFHTDNDFEKAHLAATEGSSDGGVDWYSQPFVWAQFGTLGEAQSCERRLIDVMCEFLAKVEDS